VLSVNNAKTIALDLRRYDIAKVYRPTPGGGKPRELWECDFDIVWPEGKGQNEVKRSRIKTKKSHRGGGKKQKRNVYAKKTLLIHEVITALDTFIDKFSVALGTCTIRVNHWSLLRSAIRCILGHERYIENTSTSAAQGNNNNNNTGNTAEAFYSELVDYVCDVVVVTLPVAAAASRWRHSQARTRFLAEKRISERAIRELGALFNLCSSLQSVDQITTQLKAIADSSVNKSFSTKATEDFRAALDEVTALFILLEESTCKYDVVLDLGLVGSGEVFSSDFLVQVYRLVPHDQESSHRHGHHRYEVLAVGGCYDQLLRSLKPPNSPGSRLCGLGVNIAIDKIVQCVFKQQVLISGKKHKKSNRQLAPVVLKPQQDLDGVLLFGSKNSLQEERMTVASKLWKRGVRADYLYPKDLSFAGVRRYCNELRLRWVFLFKSKLFDAKPSSVLVYDMKETKVKDSNTNTTQLEVANIPQFLRQQSSASGGKSHTEHTKQSLHSFPITLVEYSKPLNSYRKQQVIDTCARVLKGVFAQEGNFSVVCAELPLLLIRKYTQGVLELGSHSDVYKLVGFTQVAGKDKQHVQAVAEMVKHEHAKGYDVIVVFSTTELKYDLVNLS
jgi:histidyl-tRNA synthetase